MILLDTNVVSEVMRAAPSPAVLAWLNEQDSMTLFVSTVTIAEIEYGLRMLPDGKRRVGLRNRFEHFLAQAFAGRVRDFDSPAARSYGELMGGRREDRKLGFSIAEAVRMGAARVLDMEIEDLHLLALGHVGEDTCDVLLYDPMPGGSGLLEHLSARWEEVRGAALELLTPGREGSRHPREARQPRVRGGGGEVLRAR